MANNQQNTGIIAIIAIIAIALLVINGNPLSDFDPEESFKSSDDEVDIVVIDTNNDLTQSAVKDRSSKESCESSRDNAIDDGSQCVGDCIFIGNSVFNCLDGYIDNDDKDRWGYFQAPFDRSCSTSDQKSVSHNGQSYSYKQIRECMEGGDVTQDQCHDRGETSCTGSTSYRKCDISTAGNLDWRTINCDSGKECVEIFDGEAHCQSSSTTVSGSCVGVNDPSSNNYRALDFRIVSATLDKPSAKEKEIVTATITVKNEDACFGQQIVEFGLFPNSWGWVQTFAVTNPIADFVGCCPLNSYVGSRFIKLDSGQSTTFSIPVIAQNKRSIDNCNSNLITAWNPSTDYKPIVEIFRDCAGSGFPILKAPNGVKTLSTFDVECIVETEVCDGIDNDCDGQVDESGCGTGSVGTGSKCENFWENPKENCEVFSFIWIVGGIFGLFIVLSIVGKGGKKR